MRLPSIISRRGQIRQRYVEGLSRAEIAEVLDIEVGRVKTLLFEALQRMRQHGSL